MKAVGSSGKSVGKEAGPRVGVVQERKQELVGGARDAATAQMVTMQGGSETATGSTEAAPGNKENGKVTLGRLEGNWRASEASETLSGLFNRDHMYIYIF